MGDRTVEDIQAAVLGQRRRKWLTPILAQLRPGERVLELGSGTGELSAALARHGCEVVLADLSGKSLRLSEQLFARLGLTGEFRQMDILQPFPAADGEVDWVWSSGLLEHFSIDELAHIMRESARVAREGVIALTPNARCVPYRLGKWLQERTDTWPWGLEIPKWSLAETFRSVGLGDVEELSVDASQGFELLFPVGTRFHSVVEVLRRRPLLLRDLERAWQGYLLVTVGRKSRAA